MDVKDVIEEYIKNNGFDGLCSEECGCSMDDIFACGEAMPSCIFGYRHKIPCHDCDNNQCEANVENEFSKNVEEADSYYICDVKKK